VRRHGDNSSVDQRFEVAVVGSAQCDPLFRYRTAANNPEHAFAREHDPDRALGELGRSAGENLMATKTLAAKAAADKGRRQVYISNLAPKISSS
jgi:hypothetical protein